VRLAKSNPYTWGPIFKNNKEYLRAAMESYIQLLSNFKETLENDDEEALYNLMIKANDIKRILN
jgi:prephenate dehydrogenase